MEPYNKVKAGAALRNWLLSAPAIMNRRRITGPRVACRRGQRRRRGRADRHQDDTGEKRQDCRHSFHFVQSLHGFLRFDVS
jgi:hypothetical protein